MTTIKRILLAEDNARDVELTLAALESCNLAECYKLGVNAYVVKPLDFPQFAAAVKQVGAFWAILNEVPSHPRLDQP